MRTIALPLAMLAGIFAVFMQAAPAQAQATRTWVSGVGDDANPCSRTAPCKTFAGAISKTAAGGEINVLDPGGFGAVTITKSITIRSDSIEAGVLVSAGNGININAADTDQVVLYGLDIEGLGTGADGVKIFKAAAVQITKCSIHHFSGNGVNLVSTTPNTRITISNSYISQNNGGVNLQGGNGGTVVPNSANIIDTIIDGNVTFGVQANGTGNAVSIWRTSVLGSPTGISILNSAVIASRGPSNVLNGTTTGLTPINFQ